MSDARFGPVAARLAGWSGVALGWRPHEFWRTTPAEVAAIVAALMPPDTAPVTRVDIEKLEAGGG